MHSLQLIEQLAPGGRMVIPVGPEHGAQEFMQVRDDDMSQLSSVSLEVSLEEP